MRSRISNSIEGFVTFEVFTAVRNFDCDRMDYDAFEFCRWLPTSTHTM